MLKMLPSIRTHLNNETMGLGTKAMDHFDNSALDCGWVRTGTINPSEPQIANKAVVAHYYLTLLNSLENISDFPGVEKFTKRCWEMTVSRCRFGNSSEHADQREFSAAPVQRERLATPFSVSLRGNVFCFFLKAEGSWLQPKGFCCVIPEWIIIWLKGKRDVCFFLLLSVILTKSEMLAQ